MSAVPFWLLVVVAVSGALNAALRRDPMQAVRGLVAAGVASSGLFLQLGDLPAAALALVLAAIGEVTGRRATRDTTVAFARDTAPGAADRPPLRPVLPLLALVVLLMRPVFMTRWPLAIGPQPVAGLRLYLAICIVLFAIGLYGIVARRSSAAAWLSVALMQIAVAIAFAAASHLVADASPAWVITYPLLALSAMTAATGTRTVLEGDASALASRVVPMLGTEVLVAVVSIAAVALVASAW